MRRCSSCGAVYPETERFCAEDGAALTAPASDGAPVQEAPLWNDRTELSRPFSTPARTEAPRAPALTQRHSQGSPLATLPEPESALATLPDEEEPPAPREDASTHPDAPQTNTVPEEEPASAPPAPEEAPAHGMVPSPPEAADRSGEMVGTYRLTRKLAEGGMGVVYVATHPILERTIAVKLIHPAFMRDPLAAWRFMDEAKALSRSQHPNIVEVYDLGQLDDGTFFLQMELLQGESLRDRLQRGPLPADEVRRIGVGVAAGLGAAHDQGIIHRDLKPENIFLCEDGAVKLLDFGVVKLSRQDLEFTRTQPGILVGTPEYMSPEQILNEQALDARADLYSLGLVLFEALTGRMPFQASSLLELLTMHVNTPAPRPSALLGAPVDAQVEEAVLRCLSKSRDERFPTARALLEALTQRPQPPSNPSQAVSAVVARAVAGELTPGDLRRGAALSPELSLLGRRWRRVDAVNFGDPKSEAEHELRAPSSTRRVRLEGSFPNGRSLSDDGLWHPGELSFTLRGLTPGEDAILLLRVDVGGERPWEASLFVGPEPLPRRPLEADPAHRWRHETLLLPGGRVTTPSIRVRRCPPEGQGLTLFAAWLYQPLPGQANTPLVDTRTLPPSEGPS